MKSKNQARPERTPQAAYAGYYPVIAPLVMGTGIGDGKTTSCVMAQAATIDALRRGKTLDAPTDEMECACPVLRRIAIRLNDTNWWESDTERTEVLRPLIPMLLNSRGDKALTDRRIFYVADQSVRALTPMRLEFIAKHTKSAKVKKANADGAAQLRALDPITDKASALRARDACERLRADAYAYAYAASAYAYAYAYAYADAYAYASAADAYAYASAAQKLKYRAALLAVFSELAAMK